MSARKFVVHYQTSVEGIDGLKALRATSNFARGRFGLRTTDAHEILPTTAPAVSTIEPSKGGQVVTPEPI